MKKTTRRILALALSLALVCTLAAAAFSATYATLVRDEYLDDHVTAVLDMRELRIDLDFTFEDSQAREIEGTRTLSYTYVRRQNLLSQTRTVSAEITGSGDYRANESVSTYFFMDEATVNASIALNYGSWQDTYTMTRSLYCDSGNNW